MTNEFYEQTLSSRDQLFNSLGDVDPDVIGHLINPALMGGPRWPSLRQAFSVIRDKGSIKIASNGLSDPFDDIDEPNNGFRLEVLAETSDDIGNDLSNSWLFKLVYAISQQAAHNGQLADLINEYGVLSMELYAEDCGLQEFQNEKGMVGVMLGVENPKIPKRTQFPAEEIVILTIQLLTPDELEYVAEKGAEGRKHIHDLLGAKEIYNTISANRPSLLETPKAKGSRWKFWR